MKLPRHAEIWLHPYLLDWANRWWHRRDPVRHVWLTIADHFEPFWKRASLETARKRVSEWSDLWPQIALNSTKDTDGHPPRYTFFYPEEEYRPELIEPLAEMTQAGIADVEVHIHHNGEGRRDFVHRITQFCEVLHRQHGLLRTSEGRLRFGFIHGNWALDNSLPGGMWCGLNDEITLLRDLGCYADFTMPAGASPSQATMINRIYWATDDPDSPKSYDRGIEVRPGSPATGDLLMIPGPFGLRRGRGLRPRMETGELAAYDPPTQQRVKQWFALAPRIGEHIFIKLYAHGAQESNLRSLLGGGLKHLFDWVQQEAKRRDAKVHFVSAWQMYKAIRELCCQKTLPSSITSEFTDKRKSPLRLIQSAAG